MERGTRIVKVRKTGKGLVLGLPKDYLLISGVKRGQLVNLNWNGPKLTATPREAPKESEEETKSST